MAAAIAAGAAGHPVFVAPSPALAQTADEEAVATDDTASPAGGPERLEVDWRSVIPGETDVNVAVLLRQAVLVQREGALGKVFGWDVAEEPLSTILDNANRDNLTIRIAEIDNAIAEETRIQADSAFDTTVTLGWSYTRNDANPRQAVITRPRSDQPEGDEIEGELAGLDTVVIGCIFIDGELINPIDDTADDQNATDGCFNPGFGENGTEVTTEVEFASGETEPADFSWTGSASVSKLFPWGTSGGITLSSTFRHRSSYAITEFLGSQAGPDSDPFGFGSRSPWTSSASGFISTPLPFTRGFGRRANQQSLNRVIAESGVRSANFSEEATRNAVLSQVVEAYWTLVQTYESIRFLNLQRQSLEQRRDQARRRFDDALITEYQLQQVEAEVESLADQQEILWGNYITQSNVLLNLLSRDDETLVIPEGYEALLAAVPEIDSDGAHQEALDNSPQIKIGVESVDVSDAVVVFQEHETLPDLSLNLSLSSNQTDATFGYEGWGQSAANIVDPDTLNFNFGFRLSLPLYYRAQTAALTSARVSKRQAENALAATRQTVTRTVETALRDFDSALALIRQTRETLNLSATAYQRALRLAEDGLVSEFDVLSRYDDLLSARLGHVNALTAARITQARILAAQGLLDERIDDVVALGGGQSDG